MMRRAISLGMRARGTAEPNPTVGCVIVKGGRVIGEGYTQPYGGAHAEANALANCTESPAGAAAYVTLEPCCHTNKKTPPCVPQVIAAGIKRVVVGTLDPNPAVNGRGLDQLRAAGVEVVAPVLEAEAKQLHAPFIAGVSFRRPYVTLKWAETADGKVAGPGGIPIRISNDRSWRTVHELRTRSDAILIGSGTGLADNPRLTPRGVAPIRYPIRVVLDSKLRMLLTSTLVATAREHPTLIFADRRGSSSPRADEFRGHGAEVVGIGSDGGPIPLDLALQELGARKVTHLLVEAGPGIAKAFFDAGAADRVWLFRSPRVVNDPTAPDAVPLPNSYVRVASIDLDDNLLAEYLNPASEAYFAPAESADFVRVREAVQNGRD